VAFDDHLVVGLVLQRLGDLIELLASARKKSYLPTEEDGAGSVMTVPRALP